MDSVQAEGSPKGFSWVLFGLKVALAACVVLIVICLYYVWRHWDGMKYQSFDNEFMKTKVYYRLSQVYWKYDRVDQVTDSLISLRQMEADSALARARRVDSVRKFQNRRGFKVW